MDRKNYDIIKQMKKNSQDLEDFKATQFSGSDSIQIYLVSTTNAYDSSATMAADERRVFYFQTYDFSSTEPDDANYDSGIVNIYVDTPPPSGARYQGLKSTNLTSGFSTPILFIGTNTVEYENGCYWSVTLRNIDTVSHTVYAKGFINTTAGSNLVFGWGTAVT